MISRVRRMLFAGVIGAVSVVAGGSTLGVATAAPQPAGDGALRPAVETFEYPNAAKILKERGIALRKGDGHILLADCKVADDIVVLSTRIEEPNPDRGTFCFKVTGTGKTGYLSLEIPKVHNISTKDFSVRASLTADGQTQNINVAKNDMEVVGQGTNPPGSPTVLVELRVTG
ncbi:hypothetical protein ACH4U6_07685 [Streptomyces netropsis]|uniref:hypothetical protein n=1 Tax=Streptomyces netropsis TaxID=55404 RepID=UPI0037A6D860